MNADLLRTLGEAAVFILVGGYTAIKARNAEKQTKATGNGFANDVRRSLRRVEDAVTRTERKIDDHVAAHATAELRHRR